MVKLSDIVGLSDRVRKRANLADVLRDCDEIDGDDRIHIDLGMSDYAIPAKAAGSLIELIRALATNDARSIDQQLIAKRIEIDVPILDMSSQDDDADVTAVEVVDAPTAARAAA